MDPTDMTIAEHIDAAIEGLRGYFPPLTDLAEKVGAAPPDYGRDLAVAITNLETARMWAEQGLAKKFKEYDYYDPRVNDLERDERGKRRA